MAVAWVANHDVSALITATTARDAACSVVSAIGFIARRPMNTAATRVDDSSTGAVCWLKIWTTLASVSLDAEKS